MRSGLGRRRRVAGALAVVLMAGVPPAWAQGDAAGDRVAQSLFEEGRALLDAGRYEEACPKLAESQRLDPGGGTVLNLALCYERLGRTATAWTKYHEALSLAIADRRGEREAFAREHIAALSARLPRLRIDAGGPTQEEAILIDGEPVPRAALDSATPVDPGPHSVQASSDGHLTWRATATAKEGETTTVHIPPLEPAPRAELPRGAPLPPAGVAQAPGLAKVELRRSQAFWIAGGVAVAGAVASILAGLVALSAHAAADDKCDFARSFCRDPSGVDDAARSRTYAWISTGALGVAAAATVVAFLLPREARPQASTATVRLGLAATPGGVLMGLGVPLP